MRIRYSDRHGSKNTVPVHEARGGLALQKVLNSKSEWTVVHIRSGCTLGYLYASPSRAEARRKMNAALSCGVDFTKSAEEILTLRNANRLRVAVFGMKRTRTWERPDLKYEDLNVLKEGSAR